jgi:hypothetical protein
MKMLPVLGATLFVLTLFAGRAGADQIFQWTGDCEEGCTGSATATLTLDDSYVPGTPLSTGVFPNPYFVAFSYSSSSGAINIPGDAQFNFMTGSIPALLPGPSTGVEIDFFDPNNFTYFCAPNGSAFSVNCPSLAGWTFRFEDPVAGLSITDGHRTNPGVWSQLTVAVPEPATLALVGLALAGVGAARRRRHSEPLAGRRRLEFPGHLVLPQ